MIINKERSPIFSLYYLGSIMIKIISSTNSFNLDELYNMLNKQLYMQHKINIHINFFYYTLDWLYIQSLIDFKNGKVIYVNRKANNSKDNTY